MKWKPNEKSLFAILLRSPWWISVAIAAAVAAIAFALLPEAHRILGAFCGLPFLVIGCIAGWRQSQMPSKMRIDDTLVAVRAMSWTQFSRAIETAYRSQGYVVGAINGAGANFEMKKDGRITLVSCKRWKAAQAGVDGLQDLYATKGARNAHDCIYVATGEVTDNARAFAAKHAIRLVAGLELARLLPQEERGRKT